MKKRKNYFFDKYYVYRNGNSHKLMQSYSIINDHVEKFRSKEITVPQNKVIK